MTKLIVALDNPISMIGQTLRLNTELDIIYFKLNARSMMYPNDFKVMVSLVDTLHLNLFLDLKVYDTKDTVKAIVKDAFDIGIKFITVNSQMVAAALESKTNDNQKILSVGKLTDSDNIISTQSTIADGYIHSVKDTKFWRQYTDKIIVCPGIGPVDYPSDNHIKRYTPTEAVEAGADYVVVGRPIINAIDPVAAARAILGELKDAKGN